MFIFATPPPPKALLFFDFYDLFCAKFGGVHYLAFSIVYVEAQNFEGIFGKMLEIEENGEKKRKEKERENKRKRAMSFI